MDRYTLDRLRDIPTREELSEAARQRIREREIREERIREERFKKERLDYNRNKLDRISLRSQIQRNILNCLIDESWKTPKDISELLSISREHAANEIRKLWDKDLVKRRRLTSGNTNEYSISLSSYRY